MPVFSIGVLILGVLAVYLMRSVSNDGGGLEGAMSVAAVAHGRIAYGRYCAS